MAGRNEQALLYLRCVENRGARDVLQLLGNSIPFFAVSSVYESLTRENRIS